MNHALIEVRQALTGLANEEGQKAVQRYHKDDIKTLGISVPKLRELSKSWIKTMKPLGKQSCFAACDELWAAGWIEEAFLASELVYAFRKEFEKDDLERFRLWIAQYVSNWATCDNFCNNTVGSFLMKYPDLLPAMQHWAVQDNRWLQRAAAVSLIVPARKGLFMDVGLAIADTLLLRDDDLVQKGYGWLLKVYSKVNLDAVYAFVKARQHGMPRTALRYAIEHFPAKLRQELMQK